MVCCSGIWVCGRLWLPSDWRFVSFLYFISRSPSPSPPPSKLSLFSSISPMDQINIKTPNPKWRIYWRLIESEAPSPPRFFFGVVKQCCCFGKPPVDAPHTTRSPPSYTLYKNITLYLFKQGRGLNQLEGWRSPVHKRGRKYQRDWIYLQSMNSIKQQLRRHLGFGVFLVICTMISPHLLSFMILYNSLTK